MDKHVEIADFIQHCTEKAQTTSARIIFPEGSDTRTLHAAQQLTEEVGAAVTLLGDISEISQLAEQTDLNVDNFNIVSPKGNGNRYVGLYRENRPRTKPAVAMRIVEKPLYCGAMMLKAGEADLVVAGINHATRRVIEAARACIGLAKNVSVPSSFFVMSFTDRPPLIFADCAVNVDPTASELADIAISAGTNAERMLGVPAKVALLSFSTRGSAGGARVAKVKQAVEIAHERAPNLLIDGELQVDSALVPEIADQKGEASSSVAGEANVLVFPDLDSANIGYKLVKHLAKAQAFGPILQGFALPVADLSRGASVDEIVTTSIISLALT